jgi:putative aldouronate transport system substrate-binding protein
MDDAVHPDRDSREPGAALSRRRFLSWTSAGVAAGALGLPLLLEACAPSPPQSGAPAPPAPTTAPAASGAPPPAAPPPKPAPTPEGAGQAAPAAAPASGLPGAATTIGGVKLPTQIPFAGPKPDLAGNADGLDPAYFKFPGPLVKSVPQPPGDGTPISAITFLTLAPPPPMEQNAAWQAVNKALNATLNLTMVAGASEYQARVNVVIAGSDLPDFIYNLNILNPMGVISAVPQFVRAKCADLTPYLGGDAIKEYPNLANFSAYTWRSGVVEGKIYAIPSARPPIGSVIMYHPELFEQAGTPITNAPKDADELKRMLVAITRPQESRWGIAGNATFGLNSGGPLMGVFRVPNNWKLDPSGKLIKDWETEEFKAAVGWARDLWSAGVWHPDTPTGRANNNDFMAGRYAVWPSVWGAYVQLWDIQPKIEPNSKIYPMHPFAHDGGTPVYPAGSGNFGVTYIKQQDSSERVKMLLRVADFFAAPFGTEEWLLNYFGVKDTDYTLNDAGAPVLTEQGRNELTVTWRYITSPAYALFSAVRSQEFATVSHAAEQAMISSMQLDPTLGLYSQAAFNQGVLAQDGLYAGVSDIIQGRRPVSDLDGFVQEWRSKAGDKMRAEFQDALEASKK